MFKSTEGERKGREKRWAGDMVRAAETGRKVRGGGNMRYTYLSTHTVYQYKIVFSLFWGGYSHLGKWIQENIIFMRFCCFKLSKKIEKLLNN